MEPTNGLNKDQQLLLDHFKEYYPHKYYAAAVKCIMKNNFTKMGNSVSDITLFMEEMAKTPEEEEKAKNLSLELYTNYLCIFGDLVKMVDNNFNMATFMQETAEKIKKEDG